MSLTAKTTFKTNIITGPNGDKLGTLGHATIHNQIGNTLNSLQDDVGVDNSVDENSLKYKVENTANANRLKGKIVDTPEVDGQYARFDAASGTVQWDTPAGGGDMTSSIYDPANINEQLVGLTATQTITNKTLTSPKINENVTLTATATELNYSVGVTSAIQTQLDNKQPLDADLTAIGALAKTDSNFIVGDGATWVAESGATARTSLGLGSIATQDANNVTISGGSVTGITDLAVADGGTGASTLTANNVILGNGTSAVQFVAPSTSGNVLTSNGTTWQSTAPAASGTSFWTTVPGTPTRVSDTQFTITDTSNANLYDLIFKKGTLLKWDESGTFQTAMVISSSYSTNVVTINLVGDSLTAGFTTMKYCISMVREQVFIIAGTFPSAATTNLSKTWYNKQGVYILSADLNVSTAGSGTGSTVVDVNVAGSTKFTTKPTLTTTSASDIDNVADSPSTEIAAESAWTVDVDSVTATTAPTDGYITLFYYPASWRYRS